MNKLIIICFIVLLPTVAMGKNSLILEREQYLIHLFDYPCEKFSLPKVLVMAIARQESYMNPWILNLAGKDIHPSTKEESLQIAHQALYSGISFDVGLMQINSYWIRKYRLPLDALLDPQNNIYVGCWILAQEIRRHGMTWKAVAYYHTPFHKNPERGVDYVRRIQKHLKNILTSYDVR